MPFSPTDITGCKLWLKADSLALNDNDPISTWSDSSGSSNDATASGAVRPTFKTAQVNGLPAVQFGGSHYLLTPSITTTIDSIFIVYKHTSGSGYIIEFEGNDAANALIAGFTANVETYNSPRISVGAYSTSLFNLHEVTRGSGTTTYINGTSVTSDGTNQHAGGVFTIGASRLGTADFVTGYIAEIIFYDSVLSTGDRQSVEGYINTKYFVAAASYARHTYLPPGITQWTVGFER